MILPKLLPNYITSSLGWIYCRQEEALGYLMTLIGRAKKGFHFFRCPVFTENIGEEQKKGFVVRDEASHFFRGPHFLRGPSLQPA